jgi:hypothetical protein
MPSKAYGVLGIGILMGLLIGNFVTLRWMDSKQGPIPNQVDEKNVSIGMPSGSPGEPVLPLEDTTIHFPSADCERVGPSYDSTINPPVETCVMKTEGEEARILFVKDGQWEVVVESAMGSNEKRWPFAFSGPNATCRFTSIWNPDGSTTLEGTRFQVMCNSSPDTTLVGTATEAQFLMDWNNKTVAKLSTCESSSLLIRDPFVKSDDFSAAVSQTKCSTPYPFK